MQRAYTGERKVHVNSSKPQRELSYGHVHANPDGSGEAGLLF